MKATIFIDFDGVLHDVDAGDIEVGEDSWRIVCKSGYPPLFCHAPILWDLIKDHDVDLVVHSTWRWNHYLDDIRALFAEPMRDRIVDITNPKITGRLESIQAYIEEDGIERFLVIDDDQKPFPPKWEHLVLCDEVKGISEVRTQERIRKFLGGHR